MDKIIIAFAEKYRLRVRRDECGDSFVPGRFGTISEYGGDVFALTFLADANDNGRDNILRSRIRRALTAGLQPSQLGDCEAVLLFGGSDQAQVRAAMKLAGIKRRRRATGRPFTPARAQVVGKATQFQPARRVEGPERPQTQPIPALVGV
jgi:hypothetical protein